MSKYKEYEVQDADFKHEDTTHVMKIRFLAGNRFTIYPNRSHKYTAKVGTADGVYMGVYPASIQGGRFIVKSADLKGLSNGDYRLEIWESYMDKDGVQQTGIFPSPQAFVSFTVNKNIEDTAWDLAKDVSFQDLVNTAVVAASENIVVSDTETLPAGSKASVTQVFEDGKNKFSFHIPQGAKGEDGKMPAIRVKSVTKAAPDAQPTVSVENTADGYDLSFVIPQGKPGDSGPDGKQGVQGVPGNDGHTPVKGVDYWTDADKQAIYDEDKKYIEDAILNGKW